MGMHKEISRLLVRFFCVFIVKVAKAQIRFMKMYVGCGYQDAMFEIHKRACDLQ